MPVLMVGSVYSSWSRPVGALHLVVLHRPMAGAGTQELLLGRCGVGPMPSADSTSARPLSRLLQGSALQTSRSLHSYALCCHVQNHRCWRSNCCTLGSETQPETWRRRMRPRRWPLPSRSTATVVSCNSCNRSVLVTNSQRCTKRVTR